MGNLYAPRGAYNTGLIYINYLFKEMKEIIFRLKRENKEKSLLVFDFVFRETNILKKKLYFSNRIN